MCNYCKNCGSAPTITGLELCVGCENDRLVGEQPRDQLIICRGCLRIYPIGSPELSVDLEYCDVCPNCGKRELVNMSAIPICHWCYKIPVQEEGQTCNGCSEQAHSDNFPDD